MDIMPLCIQRRISVSDRFLCAYTGCPKFRRDCQQNYVSQAILGEYIYPEIDQVLDSLRG
ncbi:1973_t:CDS:1, partial [Diversispora eburnea]